MDWMWDKLESGEERKDDSFFIKEVDKIFMRIYWGIITKFLSDKIKVF